ncbi:MAG: hypothetical protein RL038_662 [Actinomycetota bacterium]
MTKSAEPDFLAGVRREIAHLSWLVGSWTGFGVGDSKTPEPYRYEEIVEFASDGRDFLEYRSVMWLVDDEGNRIAPGRTESGFFRGLADNHVEAFIAHPTGLVEVSMGQVVVAGLENAVITDGSLVLRAALLRNTETGEALDASTRMFRLREGRLFVAHDKAAPGESERNHYAIELVRK